MPETPLPPSGVSGRLRIDPCREPPPASSRSDASPAASMDTYERVSEVLDRIRLLHLRLRDLLLQASCSEASDRVDGLREKLSRTEELNALALAEYLREGDVSVLGTWIQYLSLEDLCRELHETEQNGFADADDLVVRKSRFDQTLVRLYRHLSRETSAPRVENFFQTLSDQAEHQAAQQSWKLLDNEI